MTAPLNSATLAKLKQQLLDHVENDLPKFQKHRSLVMSLAEQLIRHISETNHAVADILGEVDPHDRTPIIWVASRLDQIEGFPRKAGQTWVGYCKDLADYLRQQNAARTAPEIQAK
jgi:hypothetical protein